MQLKVSLFFGFTFLSFIYIPVAIAHPAQELSDKITTCESAEIDIYGSTYEVSFNSETEVLKVVEKNVYHDEEFRKFKVENATLSVDDSAVVTAQEGYAKYRLTLKPAANDQNNLQAVVEVFVGSKLSRQYTFISCTQRDI